LLEVEGKVEAPPVAEVIMSDSDLPIRDHSEDQRKIRKAMKDLAAGNTHASDYTEDSDILDCA